MKPSGITLRGVARIGFSAVISSFGFALLMIAAARVYGSHQPPPEGLAQLHLTDCALPCWLGIIPGQTTFVEAVQRLKAVYPQAVPTIENTQVSIALQADTPFGQIGFSAGDQGIVRAISLHTSKLNDVALGDVVILLGLPPARIGAYPTAVFYRCADALTIVSVGGMFGGWWQPLGIIGIQGNGASCSATLNTG